MKVLPLATARPMMASARIAAKKPERILLRQTTCAIPTKAAGHAANDTFHLGCDVLQGSFFGEPSSAKEFARVVAAS